MLDAAHSKKILTEAVAAAKKAATGAGVEVSASLVSGREANTRFARNEITSSGDVDETTVTIDVAIGKRHAATSTNQTDPASLRRAAETAARLAAIAPEDPERMPVLGPQKYAPVPSAFDAATDKLAAPARVEVAKAAIAAAKAAGVVVAGYYEHAGNADALYTSAGLFAYHPSTYAYSSMTARSTDGTGSGWAERFSRKAQGIDGPALAKIAVDKAVRSQKPKRLEPGRYSVVLEPAAVETMMFFLLGSMDARDADEGRSFFSKPGGGTKVGDKLFSDPIEITSDPADRENPSAPFDDEGFPLAPVTWIDKGAIARLAISRYWAQKTGKKATGEAQSFHLKGGTDTIEKLIAGVKRGVLVTRFWYANMVEPQTLLCTGLTRDGTFLIENGQVTAPVNNFRFNESPITVLKNVDGMTPSVVTGSSWRVPAIRTHEFNLASISEAV
jgi:predicted Zn-dependent protease